MNLATLLNVIDYEENISIIDYVSRKTLYKGVKLYVNKVDYNAEVFGVYTKDGDIIIEIC